LTVFLAYDARTSANGLTERIIPIPERTATMASVSSFLK